MTWRDSFSPLRSRNFAWYYSSRFVNTLGGMMANIALAFAVLDVTDSPSALGQVLAAHTIPMVLFLLFGGVIADRFPRTVVLQLSNLFSAATQGLLAFLVITDTATLTSMIVLAAVHGLVSAISFPAMASMVPQLVPRDELQRANALLSLSRGGLTIIGPTIGALLVVTVGSGWALAVDALTWLLAAVLLTPVKVPAAHPVGGAHQHAARAQGGLVVLRRDHLAVGGRARLRVPQHDPHRGLVHPRPGHREGHDRRAGLGLRAVGRVVRAWC